MHQPLPDSSHKKNVTNCHGRNITTNCDKKSEQKKNAFMLFIISLMTYETYFPDAPMKFVTLLSHLCSLLGSKMRRQS